MLFVPYFYHYSSHIRFFLNCFLSNNHIGILHTILTRFIPLLSRYLSLRRRTLTTTQYQTNTPLHPSFLKKRIASSHQLRERFLRIAFSQRRLHRRLKHAEKRVHQLLIVQAGRRSGLVLRFQQRSLHRPMQILDILV